MIGTCLSLGISFEIVLIKVYIPILIIAGSVPLNSNKLIRPAVSLHAN